MEKAGNKNVVLIVAILGSFLTPFMSSSINIALKVIRDEFAMSAIALSWVPMSFLLAAAIFLVPFGRIADIYGRKKIFLYGVIIFTTSSLLCAFASSPVQLIMFRALQGIGSSMLFGTGLAILTSVYPAGEKGKVLGLNVATVYLGSSLGPFIGGILTHRFGWRSIFWVIVPLGVIIIILILWKMREEWAEAKGEKFDLSGSIVLGLSLLSIMYGFSILPDIIGGLLIAAGVAGLILFGWLESKIRFPIMNVSLFRNNNVFVFSNLAALINYSATFAVGFLMSLYLQYIKGFHPENAGLILVTQPVIQAIFSPLAGRLSDRLEPQKVASIGMGFTTIGLLVFTFLSPDTPLVFIFLSLILLGFGFALFSSPNTNAVMTSVEKKFYGVASGILGTMRLMGQMLSMGIATLIFALYMGQMQITPKLYPVLLASIKTSFIILTVLCFVGIFASLARGKVHKEVGD